MTKRVRRSADEKRFLLAQKRDAGNRIKALLDEPPVKEFFKAYQDKLIREMIQMSGGDTEALRVVGLKMQALLAFKQDLSAVIGDALAAELQLAQKRDAADA